MAAIDFPNSPTLNQEFTANGRTWIWNGTVWSAKAVDTSVSRYDVQDTAPSSPTSGDVWFNSTNARTYVYYDSAWVESNPALDGKSGVVAVTSPLTNTGTDSSAVLGLNYSALQYGQNAIINGAFDMWQRGTSFTSSGYTADRWNLSTGNSTSPSVTRQSFTLGAAPVSGYEGTYYADIAGTLSNTATGYLNWEQKIEDARTLAGQTITISFWTKGSTAGTANTNVIQYFGSGGSSSVFVQNTNFSITTSWTRVVQTINIPSIAGKTIGAGSFLGVNFVKNMGTNYPEYGASNYTGTMSIWGVQLEAGSQATPFKRAGGTIQGELAACQRYYFRNTGNSYTAHGTGVGANANQADFMIKLPTAMRVAPTLVDYSSLAIFDGTNVISGITNAIMQPLNVTTDTAYISVTKSGSVTQFRPYFLINANSTSGYLGLSAEL